MKIDKLKFTKWLEDLFDVGLGKVEVKGSDVESVTDVSNVAQSQGQVSHILHATVRGAHTRREVEVTVDHQHVRYT